MLQFVKGRREGENYFSYAAVFTNAKGSCVGQCVLNQPKKADVKQKQTFKVHKLTRAFQGKTIKTGSDGIHVQSQHMRGLDRSTRSAWAMEGRKEKQSKSFFDIYMDMDIYQYWLYYMGCTFAWGCIGGWIQMYRDHFKNKTFKIEQHKNKQTSQAWWHMHAL